ncbi:hypothetical protein [Candidatus Methanodesulfokora washburnensis]|jgi:uncharacterized membrane protein|uniref:Uncharacterized protein n=1 Tax=Candidatus Methanodesulfokora washburnensis TaxID=2478471 RepID=A0A3R9PGU7_9CREN|nr:hypothetical protein [Candidatus Methanodesulfokores washburnensis]RSN74029.1 hypothetical protein D6D85_08930 [Candidatus Methanodesulfokores washburnensis]
MGLSDDEVNKIIEAVRNQLMKKPEKKVKLGDMEVDYKTIAEALSMADMNLKREIVEEMMNLMFSTKKEDSVEQ